MTPFTLEQSTAAYRIDFAFYGAAVVALAVYVLAIGPPAPRLEALAFAAAGVAAWTLIEYTLHRFVLHGLQPFSRWHAEHHGRPRALICTPTIFSAALFVMLVFLPALALLGLRRACALTLGVLIGYLIYSITHHATHHWHAGGAWMKARKRCHAVHHHREVPGCYGVTSAFWDQVFRSDSRAGGGASARRMAEIENT
jgi:sterol desaturase/sphingolipid hydroxylase (fatty acid hydroxylase superfamily)